MTANDRPVITRKGHEQGNTGQSGGLKLMTGVGPQHTPATKIWFGKASHQSSSVVLMLTSRCGMDGGTNMKSPSDRST